jgi:hypothetical protein
MSVSRPRRKDFVAVPSSRVRRRRGRDPLAGVFSFVKAKGPVGRRDALPLPEPRNPMTVRLIALATLATLAATAGLPAPAASQERDHRLALEAADALPLPATTLSLRIEEERLSYDRNRRIGNGLLAAGAVAVVGSLVDWAHHGRLGMRPAATRAMIGGMNLVAWGAERRWVARQALHRAEMWETRIQRAQAPR